jgi:hypothetical protein
MPTPAGTIVMAAALLLAACAREPAPAPRPAPPPLPDPAGMTQAAVDAERAALEAVILPPPGTARGDVEAVFGPGAEGYRDKIGRVVDPAQRQWALLPDGVRPEFEWGARLRIRFEGETVRRAHLDYPHVDKGLPICPPEPEPGSPEWEWQQSAPARKARQALRILRDLREIRERWREPLSRASWNRPAPDDPARPR